MSKNVTQVRKTNVRKAITKELTALNKIEAGIIKARNAISDNSQSVSGDTFNQIADIFAKLDIAISVVDAARQDKAHALAQTFVK